MRLFITGATGLIGRKLVLDRLERGDQVVLLSRDGEQARRLFAADANRNVTVVAGNPATPGAWQQAVAGCDAVVHLAGAGIGDRRWSEAYKKTLVNSRIDSTHQIVSAMETAAPAKRPRVFVSASAIGYYGDTREREVDETSPAGPAGDFLAHLCVQWEQQALRARSLGVRVILLRTGLVLEERGGALQRMMLPFRWFAGGPMGGGRQWMSWIHWRDLIGLLDLALTERDLDGPLNGVSPNPVRNREFARTLGAVMGRPVWLPAPRPGLRLVVGEFAKFITASSRVLPRVAQSRGYVFLYPQLESALQSLVGRETTSDSGMPESIDVGASASRMNQGPTPLPSAGTLVLVTIEAKSPVKPIRLLAIDVDGTLLRSDSSLPQGVIQACRAAQRAGCVVVLATARPPRGTRTLLSALDLTTPVINYNGAVIWNPLDDKPQFHEPLPADIAAQIAREAREVYPEIMIAIEALDHWHTDRIEARFLPNDGSAVQPDSVGPLEVALRQPITKLNLLGDSNRLRPVLKSITERYWKPRSVAVFLTDPMLIQITHPMVDKGIALQRIAKRMGLAREEVMAIGDASNDMGMIEWAGFGVAVANAYPAVLQLADAVVPSNDELGVARAIQRFVLARR